MGMEIGKKAVFFSRRAAANQVLSPVVPPKPPVLPGTVGAGPDELDLSVEPIGNRKVGGAAPNPFQHPGDPDPE